MHYQYHKYIKKILHNLNSIKNALKMDESFILK